MVELTLVGVRIELPTQTPIVLLKERDGERFLPIWIGNVEATAIAFALQGVATQRPLTHDLLKNLLDELVVSIERIVITELKEGTFYATIELRQNGSKFSVSSRPSDAIALAVRANTPIFAEEDVLSEASILISELVDQTFFATIRMSQDGKAMEVSSRPSDAIALAVRINAPIFGAEEVLEQAGIELKDDEETEVEKFREFLDQVSPEDFAAGS